MDLDPKVFYVLVALIGVMIVGSITRWVTLRFLQSKKSDARLASLRSWWVIVIAVVLAILMGRLGIVLLLGGVSCLAIREYLALVPKPGSPWQVRFLAYLAVVVQYFLVYVDWQTAVYVFIPVFFFLSVAVRMILTGFTHSFLQDASRLTWGTMLLVYFLSHAGNLLNVRATSETDDSLGLFLYLILLTEANDISQALCGRLVGRQRLAPTISPGKTWEGFAGGLLVTVVMAILLAPLLMPQAEHAVVKLPSLIAVPRFWAIVAGALISVGGLFGDLTLSEVKRDLGVKDAGSMIPGQGGVLDRVDSLTFTAPVFYYLMQFIVAVGE